MMASTTSATSAAAFGAAAAAKPRGPAAAPGCARVPVAGGRRRSGVVRCDAGVETQAQVAAKAASIAALEQFKISADRESLILASNPSPSVRFLYCSSRAYFVWWCSKSNQGTVAFVGTVAVGISFGFGGIGVAV
jgi:hypothetical protein